MRTYQFSGTGNNSSIMPLLMACTNPSRIQEAEEETPVMYDPMTQRIELDMRTLGTKCLKNTPTNYINSSKGRSTRSDRKNAIDDTKNVK